MILYLPPGLKCWPKHLHEPLIIAFALPFLRCQPWSVKETPKVHATARKMQAVWKEKGVDGRDHLRKFLLEAQRFPSMPEHVVPRMLYFK